MKFLTANKTENKNPLSTLSSGELLCHFHSQIKHSVMREITGRFEILSGSSSSKGSLVEAPHDSERKSTNQLTFSSKLNK